MKLFSCGIFEELVTSLSSITTESDLPHLLARDVLRGPFWLLVEHIRPYLLVHEALFYFLAMSCDTLFRTLTVYFRILFNLISKAQLFLLIEYCRTLFDRSGKSCFGCPAANRMRGAFSLLASFVSVRLLFRFRMTCETVDPFFPLSLRPFFSLFATLLKICTMLIDLKSTAEIVQNEGATRTNGQYVDPQIESQVACKGLIKLT